MNISVSVRSEKDILQTFLETNGKQQTLALPVRESGFGSAINGGELLCLALATCFCNDIYREAATLGIAVQSCEVHVQSEFGAAGDPGKHLRYAVKIQSGESTDRIIQLIEHTDSVAEIHKTIRLGTPISLEISDLNDTAGNPAKNS
jgi:organic hydroperoxide reductase OsmC/OhrA